MSRPSTQRRSALPLGLQRHHIVFVAYLSSIVLLGTAYSIAYGTHINNLRLSSGADSQFPSTLPGAAVAPSIQTGADGSTQLGPLPPTIALPPHHALNYWANRKNIVNRIFVKKAWLWTTAAWLAQLFFLRLAPATPRLKKDEARSGQEQATITSPVSISVLRYIVATGAWLLFANWFFGPPLAERILTATGAVCVPGSNAGLGKVEEMYCRTRTPLSSTTHPALFASSGTAKSIRAAWRGGHDISGHTFIMVLSSLLLLEDIAPYLAALVANSAVGRAVFGDAKVDQRARAVVGEQKAKLAVAASVALVGLWSWMLLNTAIYFHTPQEKVSGLIVALAAWMVLPKSN